MRIILDTNILISALIVPGGAPDYLYQCWRTGRFTLVTSKEQLDEFRPRSTSSPSRGPTNGTAAPTNSCATSTSTPGISSTTSAPASISRPSARTSSAPAWADPSFGTRYSSLPTTRATARGEEPSPSLRTRRRSIERKKYTRGRVNQSVGRLR
ncbi:MAG: PIN domain-containing protein [Acidobacteria bacterium]|nr:PIN domain-containing protein [Acidobacteriota bacterium]